MPPSSHHPSGSSTGSGAEILIVSDDPGRGLSMASQLKGMNGQLAACSVDDAHAQLRTGDTLLVLVDDQLEASQLQAILQASRITHSGLVTPVVLFGVDGQDLGRIEAGYGRGAIDVLTEPVAPAILRAKVQGLLSIEKGRHLAVREAEQLRLLVQGTTDYAIFLLDPQGLIQTWNPGGERLKGYAADEIVGRSFTVFYPQEAIDRGWPQYELAVAAEVGRFEDEGWRLRKDGTRFWANVVITALKDRDGKLIGYSKVTRDLTERRRAEDELRRSEERFRLLVEGIEDYAVFVLDTEGKVASWNRGAERLKGYQAEEILGRHFGCFYPDEAARKAWPDHELNQARKLGRFEDEGWRVRKDGSRFWANVVITALYDDDRVLRGFAKLTRDLTERKRLEENERRVLVERAAREAAEKAEAELRSSIDARRRAEAALRESEEKLRLLVDTIPQLAWMADSDGKVVWFNRRWYDYTGSTAETVLGEGWKSLIDAGVRPAVDDRWSHSIETGEPFDMVFPIRGADGECRSFLTRGRPLRDDQRRILNWFGTNTDITELRKAKEDLAASEERLRLALDAGRMGVWDWDIHSGDLRWSDSLEPLHGLAPGTFGGTFEHFQQLILPEDRERVLHAIRDAVENSASYDVEFRTVWPDGTIHWTAGKGKIYPGDDGRPSRMIGVGMDITARKRSEQTARFLADASAALSVLVDFESTLQKVASLAVPRFADWVTVDVLEADASLRRVAVAHVDHDKLKLAHEIHHRFPPDPAARHGVWEILRTGHSELTPVITPAALEQNIAHPELLDSIKSLGLKSYIAVPLRVRGRTLGVISFISAESGHHYDKLDLSVAEDLAGRTAIAIENSQLYRELRDADVRKDEFLATLAHELRNPLAPIRNGLEVLRLSGARDQVAAEIHSMMDRQLAQMVRLVDDLLDVSRITRNKLELRKAATTLQEIIQSAVETSQPLIEQAGHAFDLSLPDRPVPLKADSVRLAQVFSNLLNNATKYTDRGGRISLTAAVEDDIAVVRVRDTGVGLRRESLPQIFEMFSQVDRHLERSQGGLGIGLSLVRRLVQLHGGTVEASSEGLGHGSEFVVRLPLSHDAGTDDFDNPAPNQRPQNQRIRVLVVDDNRDAAQSLATMLKIMGNEAAIAEDGLKALELAESFRPNAILLDIGLPRLNGYEVCRHIRAQPWSSETLIIALTGWGQNEDRRRSSEAGFDYHLVKPVDVDELKRLLGLARRPSSGP